MASKMEEQCKDCKQFKILCMCTTGKTEPGFAADIGLKGRTKQYIP